MAMKTTNNKLWHENDAFWQTFGPVMFTEDKLEATSAEIDGIVQLLGVEPSMKILDLCCGVGRHSLELGRRGYEVFGVDRTESYLDKGRRVADGEGLDVEFVNCDMRRFCMLDTFDVVINMFTAFGYFEDAAEDRRVLLNAYCSLRKGGKLVIDVMGKEVAARIWQERDWHEQDGSIFLRESKVCQNWSWVENKWILLEGSERQEFEFGHRIYSAVELSRLLVDCGFRDVEVFGNLAGDDYDHTAERLVLVGEK